MSKKPVTIIFGECTISVRTGIDSDTKNTYMLSLKKTGVKRNTDIALIFSRSKSVQVVIDHLNKIKDSLSGAGY